MDGMGVGALWKSTQPTKSLLLLRGFRKKSQQGQQTTWYLYGNNVNNGIFAPYQLVNQISSINSVTA